MSLLSCKKFTQLASQSMEKPLTLREKLQYRFHYCLCFTCRRFERQIQTLEKVLALAAKGSAELDAGGPACAVGLSSEAKARMKSCFHTHKD